MIEGIEGSEPREALLEEDIDKLEVARDTEYGNQKFQVEEGATLGCEEPLRLQKDPRRLTAVYGFDLNYGL